MKPKYHNKKKMVNGIIFDSKKEAKRYEDLILLEKAGQITDLQMQVEFELIPAQREASTIGKRGAIKQGKLIERKCSYFADFTYKDKNGKLIVEDTKGMKTKEYIIKRKLMLHVHGIRIHEI